MEKVTCFLLFAYEPAFECESMLASILIATVIDVILETEFELFKLLGIIQVVISKNPELKYKMLYKWPKVVDTHNANLLDLKMDVQLWARGDSFG